MVSRIAREMSLLSRAVANVLSRKGNQGFSANGFGLRVGSSFANSMAKLNSIPWGADEKLQMF